MVKCSTWCRFSLCDKNKIAKVWPLIADSNQNMNDIYRLNHTGTHPCATDLAIEDAIDYYNMVGRRQKRKAATISATILDFEGKGYSRDPAQYTPRGSTFLRHCQCGHQRNEIQEIWPKNYSVITRSLLWQSIIKMSSAAE
jgi:hypothetical protein